MGDRSENVIYQHPEHSSCDEKLIDQMYSSVFHKLQIRIVVENKLTQLTAKTQEDRKVELQKAE